jgi:hypothetical protein
MGIRLRSTFAAITMLLSLSAHAEAQTLTTGSSYRVTTRSGSGTGAVYCYRFLERFVFEVATTTTTVLTSAGTWGTLPSTGPLNATFFQANTVTPVATSTYLGAAYIAPSTGVATISGTILTNVAGTIVPVAFTGALDPTCAQ